MKRANKGRSWNNTGIHIKRAKEELEEEAALQEEASGSAGTGMPKFARTSTEKNTTQRSLRGQ
eukprot:2760388-Prorocentrum_lima.AAC.1